MYAWVNGFSIAVAVSLLILAVVHLFRRNALAYLRKQHERQVRSQSSMSEISIVRIFREISTRETMLRQIDDPDDLYLSGAAKSIQNGIETLVPQDVNKISHNGAETVIHLGTSPSTNTAPRNEEDPFIKIQYRVNQVVKTWRRFLLMLCTVRDRVLSIISQRSENVTQCRPFSTDANTDVMMVRPPAYQSNMENGKKMNAASTSISTDANADVQMVRPPPYTSNMEKEKNKNASSRSISTGANTDVQMVRPPPYPGNIENGKRPNASSTSISAISLD